MKSDTTFSLNNFKCFPDLRLKFGRLTVLCGGNSVGKSSIIQGLLLLRSVYESKRAGQDNVLLNGQYLLSLGNSFDVTNRDAKDSAEQIQLLFYKGEYHAGVHLFADLKDAQMSLKIGSITAMQDQAASELQIPILSPNLHYLNAERLGPRQFYQITDKGRNVGWQGEYTISLLSSTEADTPLLHVPSVKMYPESKNPSLRAQVEFWMQDIVPGLKIDAKKISEINQSYVKYGGASPHNVGFGISYILPIVVAGLVARENEMLIVENPEAHLHPSGQSRIGRFLAVVASYGTQVIIETHSEHVIDGIRMAALEMEHISHEDVLINFFSKSDDDTVSVKSITVDASGDLTSYPRGFFDQIQRDFAELVRLKRKNR